MSGYNPSVPIGQPYGMSGPASLPGSGPTSPLNSGPQSPFSSGGVGSSPFTAGQQQQLQSALSAAGIWDTIAGFGGDVWGVISKVLPKNADGSIDWGGALKDIGSWVKDNKDTILQGLAAYNNYTRTNKSDAYAADALKLATKAYDAKAPLRDAGQAGMLNPSANTPDLSSLGQLGQRGLGVSAPQPLPLASGNLSNAQHLANGPSSGNPFTKTLPLAPPPTPAPTMPAQAAPQPVLPLKPAQTTPAAPLGVAPTPAQLEGPHLSAPFSPTPPGFGQRKPGEKIRPLPLATQ